MLMEVLVNSLTDLLTSAIRLANELWQKEPAAVVVGALLVYGIVLALIRWHINSQDADQRRIQSTLDALPEAVALFDSQGRLTAANEKLSGLMADNEKSINFSATGKSDLYAQISPDRHAVEEARQQALEQALDPDATLTFELPGYGSRALTVKERSTTEGGSSVSVYVPATASLSRITDPLTALSSRSRLLRELARLCNEADHRLALIILDLRSFRQINDSYGRDAGDELLRQTARQLRLHMPQDSLIARTAGDEFAVLLNGVRKKTEVEERISHLLRTLRKGIPVNDLNVPVRASVGIAYSPEHGRSVAEILKAADSACAHAKYIRDSKFVVYNSTQQRNAKARHKIEVSLQRAIQRQELSLQYQPQVDIKTNMTCGMEALIRWRTPELGEVPPSRFIPVAEESGIINQLGYWVLYRAVLDYQRLARFGMSPSTLSVNLSRKQFKGGRIVDDVRRLLAKTGFDAGRLCLEITETTLSRDTDRLHHQLQELTSLGVRIAIDDFGVGYSSLLELRDFPVSEVKIDRAFITNIASNRHSQDIVAAVVDISRSIGAEVVAEGIETQAQFDQIKALGCDRAQGYFLCEPMAATTFPDVVLTA